MVGKGAEAVLYLDGGRLVKERVKKEYRIPELDERLRRLRTRREAKNLRKLRGLGVNTPQVYEDSEREYKIVMEYIDGVLLKDFFNNQVTEADVSRYSRVIGGMLARMHEHNIIHNDLTTSNMILKDNDIYFLDMGLGFHSTRVEDKAVDLVVLRKSLKATHPSHYDVIWAGIVEGYKAYKESPEILTRVHTIEKRARYL